MKVQCKRKKNKVEGNCTNSIDSTPVTKKMNKISSREKLTD